MMGEKKEKVTGDEYQALIIRQAWGSCREVI
jgi:hypothetical protein